MARRFIRYAAGLVLLTYGFAKINGSQFTILDSELDKPRGHVSGFWLTWYYFGFSPFYGTFIGITEIVGAILLTFQRTTLLGAAILAPVLLNIVLIDLCYGVDAGATGFALLLFAAMIGLIAPHRKELTNLFWPAKRIGQDSVVLSAARWGIRIAMLGVTFAFTYWVANFSNRAPTPIDGAWDVVEVQPENLAKQAQRPSSLNTTAPTWRSSRTEAATTRRITLRSIRTASESSFGKSGYAKRAGSLTAPTILQAAS